jgi:tetratricopeptide (TPR) repeat protein
MIAALLLAVSLSDLWSRISAATSSHALSARGARQFAKRDYQSATGSFEKAGQLRPGPVASFNLGTSQVASGRREDGSSTLGKAMADRHLREAALYNRGNSALSAGAFDYAIRDYVEALKLKPSDLAAKRNLEIAMARKESQKKQQEGGNQQNPGGKKQPQPSPSAGQQGQQPRSDPNAEALLRSVQQQEQEEMRRMRRPRGERPRVGW